MIWVMIIQSDFDHKRVFYFPPRIVRSLQDMSTDDQYGSSPCEEEVDDSRQRATCSVVDPATRGAKRGNELPIKIHRPSDYSRRSMGYIQYQHQATTI